jgi:hypothetical protein
MAVAIAESEAEFAIVAEWHAWTPINRSDKTALNGLLFFNYLQRHRPHLLDFNASGDKWQHVHCMLIHAGIVKD